MRQLWLRVVENTVADWPPSNTSRNWQVSIGESETLLGLGFLGSHRTSPVFPVADDFRLPDLGSGEAIYIAFLCYDPAFGAIGKLRESAPSSVRQGLLFSLGLASVIVISDQPNGVTLCSAIVGEEPRSHETWLVRNGFIESHVCHTAAMADYPEQRLLVANYSSLPVAQRAVVDEFAASISLLAPKLAVHIPSELGTLERLVQRVNELLAEMVYVCQPDGDVPETLSEYSRDDFRSNPALVETILHQNAERLVHINAALSYLSSQATSGSVPILERRSLIRRYSLLGIGAAVLGILRIARSIENAFAAAALETAIDERADTSAALPGLDRLPSWDPRDWRDHSLGRWEGRLPRREPYPKLPYFSGRFGFREAEYTISASIHSLVAGAGPQWSLLTLTHEMLHGHVRNLFMLVFQGAPQRGPDEVWGRFYASFATRAEGKVPKGESFLDSIRTIVLTYCCLTMTHGSITHATGDDAWPTKGRKIQREFMLPAEQDLWALLERETRNINEILVQVLDLHYFYQSAVDKYIPLIWGSWSTMPQVRGDPRQYVLRSLLVIAAKERGTPYQRFEVAVQRLAELLEPLSKTDRPGAPTIAVGYGLVSDKRKAYRLFRPFHASLLLVDLAEHIFFVQSIRGGLQGGDPHLEAITDPSRGEEWLAYAMDDEFIADDVRAPAAYLADRLSRSLSEDVDEPLESRTVRMFLACASYPDGGSEA